MNFIRPGFHRLSQMLLAMSMLAGFSLSPALAQTAQTNEPIAYIGHGAFFDQRGNEIPATLEFVAEAQAWYRQKLVSSLSKEQQEKFAKFEERLNANLRAEGQTQLVVQQHALDWLMANSSVSQADSRTLGKLRLLKYQLQWKLPSRSNLQQMQQQIQKREEFKLDPQIEKQLNLPEMNPKIVPFSATLNSGQAYINECMANGVPIPPTIGVLDPAGTSGWKSQGFIPTTSQFIVQTPAEVRTYHSTSPEGVCFALPRYSDASQTTVALDGVICLGKNTSKACIWDNQMSGSQFTFPAGTQIPIGVPNPAIDPMGRYQAGGFELNGGSGGVCTDCHAGENPYIIHPDVDLGGGVTMGSLNHPPQNLPTFANNRYDPLVAAAWPQNQLSQSPTYVPTVCSACHTMGGLGGRFPHLSTDIPGYCNTILPQALAKTMPQGSPGSQTGNPQVIAFQNWCNSAPNAGPSDRGDPHFITTNGTKYDFQGGGEFTALRNSDSLFELQTRQTPVTTIPTPLPNDYTGLASCVSLNTAAAVHLGKHRVTYQPGPGGFTGVGSLQLRIDGTLTELPPGGLQFGNGDSITSIANGGFDIHAADGTHLIISPNFWMAEGLWYLDVEVLNTPAREGVMGTILGSDWLPLGPDGSSFGSPPASLADRYGLLYKKFADAWRVTKTNSLFDYAAGTSTDDFTDHNWPPEPGQPCNAPKFTGHPPQPINPERAKRLCSVIKDPDVFTNCVFDVTMTGDRGQVNAYLETLRLRDEALAAGVAIVGPSKDTGGKPSRIKRWWKEHDKD